MRKILILLPLLVCLVGCGGSDDFNVQQPVTPLPTTLTTPVDAAQGGSLQLSTHQVTIPPNSLSRDTTVTLSTSPQPSAQPRDPDFRAFGTHLVVNLGGSDVQHQGLQVQLPPPEVQGKAHVFPVQIVEGLFIPLKSTPQADGSNVVIVVGNSPRFEVGYAEGLFDYPPHVDWGSYNAYLFDSNSGNFVKFISLGQLTSGGTPPNLGPNPCMIVHGLGSSIHSQEFAPMAQYLLDQGVVTAVVGFEYDTLDSIVDNGGYLADFYAEMAKTNPNARWSHVAHSMGCLVSREAIETHSLPVAATGSITAFLCGPHLGSDVINILQGNLTTFQQMVEYMVMNDVMDFTNADGKRCEVDTDDAGFSDLAEGSSVLAALNQNASQNHPQFVYNTLAGDAPGLELDLLDDVIGKDFDDGLVDIFSANFSGIGQAGSVVYPVSHISAPEDTTYVFPQLKTWLTP